jgi:pimeloyl-ACP methyl ester carboxylesterase
LHVARERAHAFRSLTLIEPVAFHLLRDGDAADDAALTEIRAVAGGIARGLASGEYAAACGVFVDYWSGFGIWASMGQAKRAAAALRVGKVALDFHATIEQRARLAGLERLPVPTLVVHGERSPAPTRRICEHLAERLPDVRAEAIADAGHMCPITHAEEVNALITAHLDANSQHRSTASHPQHPRRESWIPQS